MKCSRCLGFMVIDTCLNLEGDRNQSWIGEWRCLNCGEIFDPHKLENRALQRQARQCVANMGGESLSFQLTGK
jgi:hypothetical protein